MTENRCVCCGEVIPEGRQVCKYCEEKAGARFLYGVTVLEENGVVRKEFNKLTIEQVKDTILKYSDSSRKIIQVYVQC